MEDILKSGFFNEDTESFEKEFSKKNFKKRRPKNPFYVEECKDIKKCPSPPIKVDNDIKLYDSSEDLAESTTESVEDEKFQELYEELKTANGTGDNVGGQFEEIYENVVVRSSQEEQTGERTGSYLPPEIYKLHMESHNQRMGILTKYVEQEEAVYNIWAGDSQADPQQRIEWSAGQLTTLYERSHCMSPSDPVSESLGWCTVDAVQWPHSLRLEDRLDFIPSKQTDVVQGVTEASGEEAYNSDHFYKVPRALLKPVTDTGSRTGEKEECDSEFVHYASTVRGSNK